MEVYFDNSATTRVRQEAVTVMTDLLSTCYGNPSSLHKMGYLAQERMKQARRQIADSLKCDPSCIYFTSGGTEADNIAILGAAYAKAKRGKKIITTAMEHEAVLNTVSYLDKNGWEIIRLMPNSEGIVTPEQVAQEVDENTVLVSVMAVNNEIGSIQPIPEICKAVKAKNKNTLVHTDAVQAFGKQTVYLRANDFDVDMLSISGHKIYAPKGIGVLYIRKGVHIQPIFFGGGQESNLRPGTENIPSACAMGVAAELLQSEMKENLQQISQVRDTILKGLSAMPQVVINSPESASPYIVNFSVPGVRSEIMLHFMESKDIYVSSGSACAKGQTSHVLKAIGLSKERVDSAIRLSFGRGNTVEQAETFLVALQEAIGRFLKPGK